nr:MAG TPA: hypothetical protein [Caudoviricetes sp.]
MISKYNKIYNYLMLINNKSFIFVKSKKKSVNQCISD